MRASAARNQKPETGGLRRTYLVRWRGSGASAYRLDPSLQLGVKLPLVAVGLLQDIFVVNLGPGDAVIRVEIVDGRGEGGGRVGHRG